MFLLKGGKLYTPQGLINADVLLDKNRVLKVDKDIEKISSYKVLNIDNLVVIPGLVDVHVHLREPGFFYKESMLSGTTAAASAGYTTIMPMPNLNPVPDSIDNLQVELNIIEKDAKIKVLPYGAITIGQKGEKIADLEGMTKNVIGFSDDGHGVQNEDIMLAAMARAKALNKPIVAHCEDNTLLHGGYVHDGEYARIHGHRGICSESEWKPIERDINLVRKSGVHYHICHVSTKESVNLIRQAKKEGLPITAETAPHYLILSDRDMKEDGRFKMNPPLRTEEDRQALIEGILDGTIDVVATDHAPHSDEEKSCGLEKSLFGVIGLEMAFPVLYTKLVKTGIMSFDKLIDVMCIKPREIFGLEKVGVYPGSIADFAIMDINKEWTIKGKECLSKGSSTPFEGWNVESKNMYTIIEGELVWKNQTRN